MANLFVIAGHGAGDPGATGHGYYEAERVRVLAKRIKELGGNNVILGDIHRNYYADDGISRLRLPERTQILELHMDAAREGARGGHVIIGGGLSPDKYDKALAEFISSILPGRARTIVNRSDLANPKRALKRGYPYRLLECGFISSKEDVNIFNDNLDTIARGILKSFDIDVTGHTVTPEPPKSHEYTGNSIVDYLASKGQPTNFAYRKKLASQHGISGYKGTATQNLALLNALRGNAPTVKYFAPFHSGSVVDGLKSIGVDSSFTNRRRIAKANGISNYMGTGSQNSKLCSLASSGRLVKPE